jgi:hypothetical protein
MPLDPRLAKLLRFFLIGIGALTTVTAVVEIVAAVKLLDPADAESLGMSRNFVITMNSLQGAVGIVLIYFGLRRRKS